MSFSTSFSTSFSDPKEESSTVFSSFNSSSTKSSTFSSKPSFFVSVDESVYFLEFLFKIIFVLYLDLISSISLKYLFSKNILSNTNIVSKSTLMLLIL